MRPQVQQEAVLSRRAALRALAAAAALAPWGAQASLFKGEALDTFANGLSWFILIVMPLAAIAIFLYVHVLPELIAEKRQHPHKDSIKMLCILSLFFGGLLWPFAWLWAYTKPVAYRAVYGVERHEDYYREMGVRARAGELSAAELEQLRHELASMADKGMLPPDLRQLRAELDAAAVAVPVVSEPVVAPPPKAVAPVAPVAGAD
jgi:CBS domain containing-hemolysin-like protein